MNNPLLVAGRDSLVAFLNVMAGRLDLEGVFGHQGCLLRAAGGDAQVVREEMFVERKYAGSSLVGSARDECAVLAAVRGLEGRRVEMDFNGHRYMVRASKVNDINALSEGRQEGAKDYEYAVSATVTWVIAHLGIKPAA